MTSFTKEELDDAKKAMESWVNKISKVKITLEQKERLPKPQITLANRNLKALKLALILIEKEKETLGE